MGSTIQFQFQINKIFIKYYPGILSRPLVTSSNIDFAKSTKSNTIVAKIINANRERPNRIDSSTRGDPLLFLKIRLNFVNFLMLKILNLTLKIDELHRIKKATYSWWKCN